jgi:hypothetical protein
MPKNPIAIGTALAALATVAFGVATPIIQRLGVGLGPFATASLLCLGRSSSEESNHASWPAVRPAVDFVVPCVFIARYVPTL